MALTGKIVASGLRRPVLVAAPVGDVKRLFIVEQGDGHQPGRIKILNRDTGTINPTPFLDLPEISTDFNEQGLLGLAFHPKFADNGFFYVNFTQHPGQDPHRLITHVRRYHVSVHDPNRADPASATTVLTFPQPSPAERFKNHKCGWLSFGPRDGFLYVGTGDGGPLAGHDPNNNAQNLGVLLGKMLRLDVDGDAFPADPDRNYAIPPDNPFVNHAAARPEIWAFGLRNPWRNCFDRETGDLYLADVGQNTFEEVNFQPASSKGGENYGWRAKEGKHPTPTLNPPDPIPPGVTDPIHEYGHDDGSAIIGGFVYRGQKIAGLRGTYFFGDLDGRIWTFRVVSGNVTEFTERTTELTPPGGSIANLTSFGEDGEGEMYFMTIDGNVFAVLGT
ncbi:MAG: PQQ-dependent sugar dehydrogenase [Planctomycetes bacterium]|nr:PQQ-dependent sugar dehydrogenase [Planctomycetota bacterium]